MTDSGPDDKKPAGDGGAPAPDVEARLKEQIESAISKLDLALRQLADKDNHLKRIQRDLPLQLDRREENVILRVLPVVDSFQLALKSMETASDVQALKDGVKAIYGLLEAFLREHQVKPIDCLEANFDPKFHEAVARAISHEVPEGRILDVMQPGYTYKDRVMRPARVLVAASPPAPATTGDPAEGGDGDETGPVH